MRLWVLAPLALALLAGAVVAQAPAQPVGRLTVESPTAPLIPGDPPTFVLARLEWSCSQEELTVQPSTLLAANLGALEHANGFGAFLDPSSHSVAPLGPDQCTDATLRHAVESRVGIEVYQPLPAFSEPHVRVEARVNAQKAGGVVTGERYDWGPFMGNLTFTVAYVPAATFMAVCLDQFPGDPPEVPLSCALHVRDESNGPSVVTVTATPAAEARGIDFDLPPPTEISSHGTELHLGIRIPPGIHRPGTEYPFDVTYDVGPAGGRDGPHVLHTERLSVSTDEPPNDVPFPVGPVPALAALLVGIFRRRRGR